jgi:hypothetical protein
LANGDISESDWLELYRQLLGQLEKRGFAEVRAEIETAAAAPVVEESSPEDEARVSRMIRGEVGKAIIRRRNPEEVFYAAVRVLRTRLMEVPSVAARVADLIGVPATSIEFRVDYEERYALVETKPQVLHAMLVNETDERAIRKSLAILGADDDRARA